MKIKETKEKIIENLENLKEFEVSYCEEIQYCKKFKASSMKEIKERWDNGELEFGNEDIIDGDFIENSLIIDEGED